jgi:hypothetical protein
MQSLESRSSASESPTAARRISEAEAGLQQLLANRQAETHRRGLAIRTAAFIDRLVELVQRYGEHLFVCFDDPRIPPTTNDLERFFGASKAQARHALGTKSTANGVARNLGADLLRAFATAWTCPGERLLVLLEGVSADAYLGARRKMEVGELPARLSRSRRRYPEAHIQGLLDVWFGRTPPGASGPP